MNSTELLDRLEADAAACLMFLAVTQERWRSDGRYLAAEAERRLAKP